MVCGAVVCAIERIVRVGLVEEAEPFVQKRRHTKDVEPDNSSCVKCARAFFESVPSTLSLKYV